MSKITCTKRTKFVLYLRAFPNNFHPSHGTVDDIGVVITMAKETVRERFKIEICVSWLPLMSGMPLTRHCGILLMPRFLSLACQHILGGSLGYN